MILCAMFISLSCKENEPSFSASKKPPSLAALTIVRKGLPEVNFQRIAVPGFLEAFDRPFLDLADALLGEIVLLTDLLDGGAVVAFQSEVSGEDLGFPHAERS